MKLYYTDSYEYLAKKLSKYFEIGKMDKRNFSDGESYFRFLDNIKREDILILGGTISDKEVLDLYDMACAASMLGAKSINLIIPYFGYSTMERAEKSGEVVKAKVRARLFSSIPRAIEINTMYILDLHVEGLMHYTEGTLHSVHMGTKSLIKKVIIKINSKKLVLASPDAGRVKKVSRLAKELNLSFALALKDRNGEEVSSITAHGNVKGKDVLIYDDMIRSGGTIIEAVENYKSLGAKDIYVMTSHGLFISDKLFNNKEIKKIFVTNSHPNVFKYKDKLEILDISKIIKESIDENL